MRPEGWIALACVAVTIVIVCVTSWFWLSPERFSDQWELFLGYWLSSVVILGGGWLVYKMYVRDSTQLGLLASIALVYVASIAAGICLAGLGDSALPTIELVSGEKTDQVGLLSSSGETWHMACNGSLLAIPAGEVTDVRKMGRISDLDDSKTEETEHTSKEPDQDCPPDSGKTSEESNATEVDVTVEVVSFPEVNNFSGSGSITGDNRDTVTVQKEP